MNKLRWTQHDDGRLFSNDGRYLIAPEYDNTSTVSGWSLGKIIPGYCGLQGYSEIATGLHDQQHAMNEADRHAEATAEQDRARRTGVQIGERKLTGRERQRLAELCGDTGTASVLAAIGELLGESHPSKESGASWRNRLGEAASYVNIELRWHFAKH